ncbi:peptidoglycan-associated lipoprotein Pal [Crenobacter sp. SG2303]|uniref:Peptidoglycan-associated lipoprotein n=1 Tax=Crenobacter oryzisoli TaxID=3056844 RepID=A0ABT7XJG7_9NEIS|nr:peptidoglycan-associated lipoprotein Pal [Crenobacter sp. SG2303]MDN0073926.1 peptidoglycan-associated lipoprotein Pal [Crenobacter sp. SG2303]
MNWKQLALGAATVLALAACSSTKPMDPAATAPVASGSGANSGATAGAQQGGAVDPLNDPNSQLAKRNVYFDFDSSSVRSSEKPTVEAHAAYLAAHPDRKLQVQGNTDSRGSREYNLALGQRRAESVKNAMQVLGAKDSQIEAISYGKEKPKSNGSSDADYAENRRDDIVYQGQ